MFRAEFQAGTELGKLASEIMAAGGLVGDEIVDAMVASRISRPDCAGGFLLDGYPRTVPQATVLWGLLQQKRLPDPVVIHLSVPDDLLVARMTARRQCPQCKRIYNLVSQPPKVADRCDDDGTGLTAREDDKEAAIRQRLRAYHEQTGPILEWYGASAVHRVDGGMAPDQVARAIEQVVIAAQKASAK
jgi:adenylate kinase